MITLTNLQKQILAFVALLAAMLITAYIAADLYRTIMMGLGGWQVGSWIGNWSRERWPR